MKRRTLLILAQILNIDDSEAREGELERIEAFFYKNLKPNVFWGHAGIEVQHDKSFETACALINQSRGKDPKLMTVIEYLQTLELMKKQAPKKSHSRSKKYA